MSDLVLDASLTLQWFLEDETDRYDALKVLAALASKRAVVPMLWFYEVGNGLLMAYRRKRITFDQIDGFLTRLKALPIEAEHEGQTDVFQLPSVAQKHSLTNYDAAYSALALESHLPLATTDTDLRRAAAASGVEILTV